MSVLARPAAVRMSPLLVITLALVFLPGCSLGGGQGPKPAFEGAVFPAGVRARDFTLTNQQGKTVTFSQVGGQVKIVAFVPVQARVGFVVVQQIRGALDELGAMAAAVRVVLMSTEGPIAGTLSRHFLQEASLAGRAELVTGSPAQLRAVWHAYGVPPASAGERAYLSSTPVTLVDRQGFERVGFPVEQLTPEGLAHDIRELVHGA